MTGARRESRWLTTSRTLSGLPIPAGGPTPVSTEGAPELADEKRVALGEVVDPLGELAQLGSEIAAGGTANELGNLVAGEPGKPQPDDVIRPAEVGERVREGLRHVGLGVAERGEQQHACVSRGACEMAQEEQGRRVGPVPVLEHEQRRPAAGDADEEIRDGRVQPVPLGIRIGPDRGRKLADPDR